MSPATDRDLPSFTSGKPDGSRHILGGRSSYDQRRPFVDRMVPAPMGGLIVRIPRADYRTRQADLQLAYRRLTEYACHDSCPWSEVMQAG